MEFNKKIRGKFKVKFVLILFFLIIFNSCSYLGGFKEVGPESIREFESKINSSNEINQSDLKKTNSTQIANALIDSINNLKKLQKELHLLENDIEEINLNLNQIPKEELTPETIEYLNYLNLLTNQSKNFVKTLYASTRTWDDYLSSQSYDPKEFSEINQSDLIDSLRKPIEEFK